VEKMTAIITAIIVGLAIILGVGSRFAFKSTDNPVEEIAEVVIKDKTNIDIDLSPDTPETK
jgi:hypothetical protein